MSSPAAEFRRLTRRIRKDLDKRMFEVLDKKEVLASPEGALYVKLKARDAILGTCRKFGIDPKAFGLAPSEEVES